MARTREPLKNRRELSRINIKLVPSSSWNRHVGYRLRKHDQLRPRRRLRPSQSTFKGLRSGTQFRPRYIDNGPRLLHCDHQTVEVALTIAPTELPVSLSCAPFWLVSTIACAPRTMAAPTFPRIDAGDVRRTADVTHDAAEVCLGSAESEPIAKAADAERVSPTVEKERSRPCRTANDEARLDHPERDATAVGYAGESSVTPMRVSNAIKLERNADVTRIDSTPRGKMKIPNSAPGHHTGTMARIRDRFGQRRSCEQARTSGRSC